MTVTIYSSEDYPQGSEQWRALRVGKPTASNFDRIMAGGAGKTRDDYLRKIAGEIITGEPMVEFKSEYMDRGSEREAELRAAFAMIENVEVQQVGFVERTEPYGKIGASPDGLIGDDSGLELKKAEPHVLISILKTNQVPTEHVKQIQGNMLVTGRSSWWIAIGFPGMKMFRRKVRRDEAEIARLRIGLESFWRDLNEIVSWHGKL